MELNEMIEALPPEPTDFDEQLRSVYASMGVPELLVRTWEGDDLDTLLGKTTDQWAYHCTACGQSGLTPKKGVRMKDLTRCPLCGARVQPARWGWKGKPLRRALAYTVHRGAGRTIWVRCWRTSLIQLSQYEGSYFDVWCVAAYLFEDGRAVKLSKKMGQ